MLDATQINEFSKGVFPALFHRFIENRIYCLRFFKDFSWRYVVIDDTLPVNRDTDEILFARCTKQQELWVPLIEKAYAKLSGCYQATTSGSIDDALVDMTGYACEKLKYEGMQFEKQKESIWQSLMNAQ